MGNEPDLSLTHGDLADFKERFEVGVLVVRSLDDPESMRFWHILNRKPGEAIMQHGTGAVAVLGVYEGRISSVQLFQGEDAVPLLEEYGFRVSPGVRRLISSLLSRREPPAAALSSLSFLEKLPRTVQGVLHYRLSWGGILAVRLSSSGRVSSHRWLTGGEALAFMRNLSRNDRVD